MAGSIREIAKICGVSEGTVDRALNNRSGIKESTKNRILEVARELNYQPNHLARCLATGRTNTIGVVCINMADTFFSTLLEAIEAAAKKKGYFVTLVLTHNCIQEELNGIRYLINRGVDGIILFPVAGGTEYVNMLKGYNIPIVTIYNRISDTFPHIDVDGYESMRNAVAFIHGKGYGSIAYLDINFARAKEAGINIYSFERRRAGYRQAVTEMGLQSEIIEDYDRDNVLDYIRNNKKMKCAILCAYDNLAIRVLSMCRLEGLSVPGDVGLMGFNNQSVLNDIYPRIYSIDCNIDEIGKTAFGKLFQLINSAKDSGNETGIEDSVIEYSFSEGETL